MTPSLEEILSMYSKGECTLAQAEQWIGTLIDGAMSREALRDTFASMAAIGRDERGNLLPASVKAVMGCATPEEDPQFKNCDLAEGVGPAKAFGWWCLAEARIRYAKAEAMLEARCL